LLVVARVIGQRWLSLTIEPDESSEWKSSVRKKKLKKPEDRRG
jgi:hypothetical protein